MGTNKKRARCFCFRHFAVVIRHLISCPQRTPKSSANVTAKVLGPAKALQRLRKSTLRWLRSFLLPKCCRWRRAFPLAFISGLKSAWRMITYRKVFPLCKSHRIREVRIRQSKVFHWIEYLTYKKKRSFRDKLSRIAGSSFRITTIYTIFASNL